jgi:hypothetical protein
MDVYRFSANATGVGNHFVAHALYKANKNFFLPRRQANDYLLKTVDHSTI